MVESRAARSWFYSRELATQREKEERSRELKEIPVTYKEKILKEVSVSQVLPHLVYEGVFSLRECQEVLSWDCSGKRIESFLLKLCSKGPQAFCAFCSHLEEFCPYLLTCFFLYYQEQMHRILRDTSAAGEEVRVRAQLEPGGALETERQKPSLQLFNKKEEGRTSPTFKNSYCCMEKNHTTVGHMEVFFKDVFILETKWDRHTVRFSRVISDVNIYLYSST